jgi:hypothetical protein
MALVGQQEISNCINNNLRALSVSRQKQEILVEFAERLGFSVKDVDQGLLHIIVMGGAIGRGEVWPLGWRDAQKSLTDDQVRAVEEAYLKIVEDFPQDLKDSHAKVFAEPQLMGKLIRG